MRKSKEQMLQQQLEGRRRKKYRRRDILACRTKLVHLKHFMRLKFQLRDELAPVVVKSFAGNDRGLAFSSNIQSASWLRRDQLEFRAYSVNDSPVSFNDVPTSGELFQSYVGALRPVSVNSIGIMHKEIGIRGWLQQLTYSRPFIWRFCTVM